MDKKIARLTAYLPGLLGQIATKDDEQIIKIAADARQLERFAFLIRGMCASVLRRRYPHRLSGGRGRRDQAGQGIQAQMTRLAEQARVDRKTLETDARINDTFFDDIQESTLEHIPTLAREYYVIALTAPDPHAAIRLAGERRSDSRYGIAQFRADVHLSKRVSGIHARSFELRTQQSQKQRMSSSNTLLLHDGQVSTFGRTTSFCDSAFMFPPPCLCRTPKPIQSANGCGKPLYDATLMPQRLGESAHQSGL